RRIPPRHVVDQREAAGRRRKRTRGLDVVLDQNRHAVERSARRRPAIQRSRLLERAGIDRDHGVEQGIQLLDPLKGESSAPFGAGLVEDGPAALRLERGLAADEGDDANHKEQANHDSSRLTIPTESAQSNASSCVVIISIALYSTQTRDCFSRRSPSIAPITSVQ